MAKPALRLVAKNDPTADAMSTSALVDQQVKVAQFLWSAWICSWVMLLDPGSYTMHSPPYRID